MRVDFIWPEKFESVMGMDIYSDMPLYFDKYLSNDATYETSPDIFHFNFLGITGDFMLKEDGTMEVFNASIPDGEISIEYDFIKADRYSTPEFIIKTGNGYRYVFGGTFESVEYNVFADDAAMITPSAFKLRRIIAPNGNEALYCYGHHSKEVSQIMSYYTNMSAENDRHFHYSSIKSHKSVISVFSSPVTQINISGKKMIEFTYTENGYDENSKDSFDNPSGLIGLNYDFYYQNPIDLRRIEVDNWTGDSVCQISFEKDFIGSRPSRMFLSSISSSLDGKFMFSYNTTGMQPPHNNTVATDFWGFWNGTGYTGLLTDYLLLNQLNGSLYNQFGTDFTAKNPSFIYSSFGGLEKIIYPTGGHSDITYEQHSVSERINKSQGGDSYYEVLDTSMIAGGLRVKRIDNYGSGVSDYVQYSYVASDGSPRSSGVLMYMPLYGMRTNYRYYLDDGSNILVQSLGFTDECDKSPRYDPIVVYREVRETFANGSYNKSVFDFNEDVFPHFEQDYTVLKKNIGVNQIYPPSDDDSQYAQSIRKFVLPPMSDYSRTRGKLKEKHEYDASGRLMKSEYIHYDNYVACSRKSYFKF